MNTAEETYRKWFGNACDTTKRAIVKSNIIECMEEYASHRPDPQPIHELSQLKNDCYVWIKSSSNGDVKCVSYDANYKEIYFAGNDTSYSIGEVSDEYDSFVIAKAPKF